MSAKKGAVKADLDRVADEADSDGRASVSVADAIGGAGKAHRPVGIDDPQDLGALGRLRRSSVVGAPIHLVVVIDQMTARVGGDHDAVVGDVKQPIGRLDRDGFPGQVTSDVITVLEDADATGPIDATSDDLLWRLCFLPLCDIAVDDLEARLRRKLEAPDRRNVAQ